MQAFSAAGQQFYQAQAQTRSGRGRSDMGGMGEQPDLETAQAGAKPADDDVIEADYEIVDEEKK
jgi:hypothetical protein